MEHISGVDKAVQISVKQNTKFLAVNDDLSRFGFICLIKLFD